MGYKKNITVLVVLSFVFIQNIFAQKINIVPKIEIIPLHLFLQKNADSTIIFEKANYKFNNTEYFILSKKGDTISIYQYRQPISLNKRILIPQAIRTEFYKRDRQDYINKPKTFNIYFNPIYLSIDSAAIFWNDVSKLKPWQIKDDSVDGEGCPINNKNIYDGGGINLYIINKDSIRRLYFYAPNFYENEVCPGRKGRQAAIEIERLFKVNFKD